MFMPILGDLPFPRGQTAGGDLVTPVAGYKKEIEGRAYYANDTEHDTSVPLVLLAVRNVTGGAITVARKFAMLSISVAKACIGQVSTFPNVTAGQVALPLDDAYTVGGTIPSLDIFYLVLFGFCSVLTGASVTNLTAGESIASDNAGLIADTNGGAAAGEFVIGRCDYAASYTTATATRMLVSPGQLALPPAAG